MIKSLLLNSLIIFFIIAIYYFDLFDFLTSNLFVWILLGFILILFIIAFKVLGNPFKTKTNKEEADKKE